MWRKSWNTFEAYIRIQKLRYGEEAFSFEATTDGDIGEWKVPSLLLQTLVENSVVHGVSLDRKSEISLYLTNETYEDGEYLYICISDTGNGFSKEALDAIETTRLIIYHRPSPCRHLQYKTPPGADVRRTSEHYVLQYG